MHESQIGYEQQYQVVAADGTVLWQGGAIINGIYRVQNAGAAWQAGNAISPSASTVIAGQYNPGTSDPFVVALYGVIAPTSAWPGFLGVALAPAAVSTTVPVPLALVAGVGSIAPVQMTSAAGALGDALGGSATAGQCAVAGAVGGTAVVVGKTLGVCVKAGATLTNSAVSGYSGAVAGVLVCPH
jgi:hypothetical protein